MSGSILPPSAASRRVRTRSSTPLTPRRAKSYGTAATRSSHLSTGADSRSPTAKSTSARSTAPCTASGSRNESVVVGRELAGVLRPRAESGPRLAAQTARRLGRADALRKRKRRVGRSWAGREANRVFRRSNHRKLAEIDVFFAEIVHKSRYFEANQRPNAGPVPPGRDRTEAQSCRDPGRRQRPRRHHRSRHRTDDRGEPHVDSRACKG